MIAVAERVARTLAIRLPLAGEMVTVSASIGIAYSADASAEASSLLRQADIAMYRAKTNGRARFEFADAELQERATRQVELETDLRRLLAAVDGPQAEAVAAEVGELVLDYQPCFSALSGSVVACEALLRWRHPTRGLLGPGEFLDVAEDRALMVPLGAWVLRTACRRAAALAGGARRRRARGVGQRVGSPAGPAAVRRACRPHARRDGAGAGPALAGDHRAAGAVDGGCDPRGPRRAGRDGCAARGGRLRHRLRRAGVPAAAAGVRPEGGRLLRRGDRQGPDRGGARGDRGGAGQGPGPHRRGRGDRDRRAAVRGLRPGGGHPAGVPAGQARRPEVVPELVRAEATSDVLPGRC